MCPSQHLQRYSEGFAKLVYFLLVTEVWGTKLDVRDLGGHLDITNRARAGTLAQRAIPGFFGLVLDFHAAVLRLWGQRGWVLCPPSPLAPSWVPQARLCATCWCLWVLSFPEPRCWRTVLLVSFFVAVQHHCWSQVLGQSCLFHALMFAPFARLLVPSSSVVFFGIACRVLVSAVRRSPSLGLGLLRVVLRARCVRATCHVSHSALPVALAIWVLHLCQLHGLAGSSDELALCGAPRQPCAQLTACCIVAGLTPML